MDNSKKIIYDLCGGSGNWSKPYRDAGYDVRLLTLPEHDITKIVCITEDVYGILAAPPCTMFSLARTRAKVPRDFMVGMKLVSACLNIIWQCNARHKLKFWALENPVGYLQEFLGRPAFKFQNWEFGEMYSKPTYLWGRFTDPVKSVFVKPEGVRLYSEYKFDTSANRAKTSLLFADAFFRANR